MFNDNDLHPDDLKKREYLIKALSLVSLSVSPAGVAYPAWWSKKSKKLDADKSIYKLKGVVQVNGQTANLDTRIRAGDTVTTQRKSKVIFVVGSDSFIMRSHSEMVIEGAGFFVDALRILTGGVLSVFGIRKPDQTLSLSSSTATIGIRGSGVYLEVEPDLTYLCTCYGQVSLSSSEDPNDTELVTAKHHDEPRYISNKASKGTRIRSAPVKNHTDTELKLLEAIVGREVPPDFESESRKKSYTK